MRPTQEDVARRAGVSRALVSLVMRDAPNVSPTRRRTVLRAADELGYRPNASARSLASKEVRTFGVLIHDVTNPYFGLVYGSVAAAAERAGYDLLVAPGTRSPEREVSLVRTLLEHQIAGLVLLSPMMRTADLQRLSGTVPCVIIGSDTSVAGVDAVTTDEVQAARLVVEHLVGLGHRDIAHVTGGPTRPARDREAGYRAVMAEAGLEPRVVPGEFTPEGGREGGEGLMALDPLPTAVMAANDLTAVGVMGVLRARGVDVPGDVSVVGFDDSQIAALDLVGLTSVRQPVDAFGDAAVARLAELVAETGGEARTQHIPAELVIRSSTGPVRGA
ncbi:LacI family DNA-binding transcriptional regulator [Oryzobacter telluris]|uniref:LacI family DNA-binding transcriptional regulator n=1 Tax=Oryzobacter telluris TaxID=3149179 RepID=UPI00370D6E32